MGPGWLGFSCAILTISLRSYSRYFWVESALPPQMIRSTLILENQSRPASEELLVERQRVIVCE